MYSIFFDGIIMSSHMRAVYVYTGSCIQVDVIAMKCIPWAAKKACQDSQ